MFISILYNGINFALTESDGIFAGAAENILPSLQALYDAGQYQVLPDSEPITPLPDWQTLQNRILGGDLYFIFKRITEVSLAPDANTISTARGDITDAILTVKIEEALASGFQLLTQVGGYQFTQEEKNLWKSVVDELHFSPLVYLP